jgi:hypothetical protein
LFFQKFVNVELFGTRFEWPNLNAYVELKHLLAKVAQLKQMAAIILEKKL